MPIVRIGKHRITYELRRSAFATERRITVTPGQVEVLALTADDEDDIAGFLNRKRQWLFNAVRDMEQVEASRHAVPRFMTGSKILYRGRKVRLVVRPTDAGRATVSYRNGFIVDLPDWSEKDPDRLVASELKFWLKARARRDVKQLVAAIGGRLEMRPASVRVTDMVAGWGSCGAAGNLLVNWHLIFAPKRVMEYVVAHELAHLKRRTHDEQFWAIVRKLMPNFEPARHWLDAHGATLSSAFLTPTLTLEISSELAHSNLD
ncbi:M48 family metallopeptidase [Sphingomonas nostoxanthinifaciens]|uniref:M48 family metallopeptidase n=1 Tax=Sphingomonas nostoxanthinifaciens TaxID=2872652 RepID=UPI001CC1F7C3|nr:SprT family zinc-dependent metalloprotease [Sphingomonas nostoxanthinifaciens]UAK25746.1 M48 family metallopeptidase [Sphingomonas nostoxanthinifaciens]